MNNAVSYTDIQTAQRCLLKFRYRAVDRIQPIVRNVQMHEGSLQHNMLQEAYIAMQQEKDYPLDAAWEYGQTQIDRVYTFSDELASQEDMVEVAFQRTKNYLDYYIDPWEVLHVEEQFVLMLENGLVLSCTPDLVVRDRHSEAVWVIDHKTFRTIPKETYPDLQSMLNTAAVRALYPETAGFMYNYLRKKLPTEPTLVKSGKNVSRINDIDTTYEKLRNFITTEAPELMDRDDHRRRLAELRETNKFFKRAPLYFDDYQVLNGLQDVENQVELMKFAVSNGFFPRTMVNGGITGCDRCGYRTICQAELINSDPERVLNEFYEERDDSYKWYEAEDD